MIYTSIMRALIAFFRCFAVFNNFEKQATDNFAQKNFPKDIFNSKICYRYGFSGQKSVPE